MLKVLHVTECYAGGVRRAIQTRVAATEGVEHHLLWTGDESPQDEHIWASVNEMPRGFFKRCTAVLRTAKVIQPNIIHAHSSWAGVYTRIFTQHAPVIYEPHCFKFDDPSIGLTKHIFRFAEKNLLRNTKVVGVLTSHEESLVRGMNPSMKTVRLPNVPSVDLLSATPKPQILNRIVMMGRLCAQKDPTFFREVITLARKQGIRLDAVWIGDGENKYRELLENHQINVTGWLNKRELEITLTNSVYVHTAAYEGFPLSVLDAAARGLPILVRSIPAFVGTTLIQGETPEALVQHLERIIPDENYQALALTLNQKLLSQMNNKKLAKALNELYSYANS